MNSVKVVEKNHEGIVRRQPFVEEGKTPRFQNADKKSQVVSTLAQANDGQRDFDLPRKDGQYRFPMEVCPEAAESVNPDGYIFSKKAKICVVIELTSPMEENISKRHREKIQKYRERITSSDYKIHFMVWEVGARGWIPNSVNRDLKHLGFTKSKVRQIVQSCMKMVIRSSFVIWAQRNNKNFIPTRMQLQ